MPDEVRTLREASAELDAQLRVIENGRVVCCVGLLATFYFPDGDRPEVRERAAQALDRYRAAIGDVELVWGADPVTGRPARLAGTDIGQPRTWMAGLPRLDLQMHGGREKLDADPHTVKMVVGAVSPRELSYFSFSLPFAWIAAHPRGAFVQLVSDQADILLPSHGYAGWGIVPYVGLRNRPDDFRFILALAARFRGLELDIPSRHRMYLEKEGRIKGVNWLTVLDRTRIEDLGGEGVLRRALGEGVTWIPYRRGAIIQAGPRPLLGDVNRQEPMPYYQQVARALRPIRVTSVQAIAPDYGFDQERSDQWLARFD